MNTTQKNSKPLHQKFLEFNGNKIIFLNAEGEYWIALKPILEVLGMDADSSIKTTKNDPFLGGWTSLQTVQVSKNGVNQGRKMVCLPEKYIYGWICFLRGDSPELHQYKERNQQFFCTCIGYTANAGINSPLILNE